MADEQRVQQLLEEILDSERTPEEVCRACPELLPEVRKRWQQLCLIDEQLQALFPPAAEANLASTSPPEPWHQGANLPSIPGYEVEAVLGRGGMGVVFQARQLKLNRLVALKMLIAGAYAGPQELARFRREAEAVAALRHPHIVQIYDVSDLDGQPHFTMELVEGGSLAQQLSKKRPSVRRAVELVATLASAVQFAHKSGIIHRDLKPGNILLTADGTPKITDFGLARSVNGGPAVTLSGAKLGTPSYMAPEQALGKTGALGPSVDIYALGVVLYETLTGRPPFEGETVAETERQVIAEEPAPPSRRNAAVPRDLDTICLKCLHKNPARRYASAQDFADDLHRYLDGLPVIARPVGAVERAVKWARRRPTLATLVLTLLVSLGAAVGTSIWLQQQRSSRQVVARHIIEDGIARAYELARAEQWQNARQVLADGQRHLAHVDSDELGRKTALAEAEIQFAEQLEQIRQSHASSLIERVARPQTAYQAMAQEYAQAFAAAQLDVDEVETTAAKIRASEVRLQIVAALDLWAFAAFEEHREPLQAQLLRIAQLADQDPAWRDRFRDPAVWGDKQKLVQLGSDAANARAPLAAHQLAITCLLLAKVDAKVDSVRLLRKALDRRQGDFWLNWEMGVALQRDKKYQEALAYFRVVAALRPENPWILNRLAGALSDAGQVKEALTLARRAVDLEPNNAVLRHNLAVDLLRAGNFNEAEAQCRRILEADPKNGYATIALGAALGGSKRYEDAILTYRRAIELDSRDVQAWSGLSATLAKIERNSEALVAYEKVIDLEPTNFLGHYGLGLTSFRLGRNKEAAAEFQWCVRALDRDRTAADFDSAATEESAYWMACQGLAEALCRLGQFAEARIATRRTIDLPTTNASMRKALQRQLDLCVQLLPLESRLPAVLAGNEIPTEAATQRALAEWFGKYKRLPFASARLYQSVFARQSSLAEDLDSQNRQDAAIAAALAGCGLGEDAAHLDEKTKAEVRKLALDWLRADREAWAKQYNRGTSTLDQTCAAQAMRSWQQNKDLTGIRDQDALAKLPEEERREWQHLWVDVQALASRDPQPLLDRAQAHFARREWDKAVDDYQQLFKECPLNDGEAWFEYAAVQLLAGDRPGYRQTCRQMLEGAPEAPKMRTYLLARVCTLAPDSVDDAALPLQVSARELEQYPTTFWSLTEQGALNYRANRYKEAVPLLERSLQADTRPGAAVINWLWLAMAYQKLGEKDEARRWLIKAESWLDSLGNEMPASTSPLIIHRHNWLEAHILRREAEMLLSSSPEK